MELNENRAPLKNFKAVSHILIFQVFLPTFDVYCDWFILYRLLMAESINGTPVCSAYHPENHLKMAITVAFFPILSIMFHLAHWWEHEKKEHGGLGRLRTLPQLSESMVAKNWWHRNFITTLKQTDGAYFQTIPFFVKITQH